MPRLFYMEYVEPETLLYTINVTSGSNGSVSPSTSSYSPGGSQVFNFTPNTNYLVSNVIVDGVSIGNPTTYTFNNIQATHTLQVVFSADAQIGSWMSGTTQTFWIYR